MHANKAGPMASLVCVKAIHTNGVCKLILCNIFPNIEPILVILLSLVPNLPLGL